MKGTSVADDTRDTTGPLSDRQRLILKGICNGRTHAQIADALGVSKSFVSNMLISSILPKLNVRRTYEACALYGRSQGFLDAADRVETLRVPRPVDEAEEHMNYVLEEVAQTFRNRAAELLP